MNKQSRNLDRVPPTLPPATAPKPEEAPKVRQARASGIELHPTHPAREVSRRYLKARARKLLRDEANSTRTKMISKILMLYLGSMRIVLLVSESSAELPWRNITGSCYTPHKNSGHRRALPCAHRHSLLTKSGHLPEFL
uniref:Uncharacterized protein n=1 Tax=Rhodosorus marinus TaxID=101924 RepID=A0A7S2ZVQ5_9RHOD|mmetsp:Transcript_32434/g.127223  ORF Transcript_32434/g.127223 Transcript_32434/m.127223 type:complete len:139 (+) Transcript_32434:615-1031(+)